jgi:hypothetical protein
VGVATVWTVRGSNFCSDKRFYSSPKRPDMLWGPPSPLRSVYRGSSPGLKRPGRDIDHSSLSSAEVENKWNYTSTPPVV